MLILATYNPENDLARLIKEMNKIDGTAYEIENDDNNALEGILFQDQIMRINFEKYSDFVMFDATYKLNDRQMPLTIMLVVDHHGESQIDQDRE